MTQLSRSNIFDAGVFTPNRAMTKHTDPKTGEVVVIKRPHGRHVKYVCKNGHVRFVRLTNAPSIQSDARYEQYTRKQQTRNGGVPFGACPLRDENGTIGDEFFPADMREPCSRDQYSETNCCHHVTYLIEVRQAANRKRQDERQERLNRSEVREQKKLAIAEQNSERLAEVLGKLIGNQDDQTKRPGRKG